MHNFVLLAHDHCAISEVYKWKQGLRMISRNRIYSIPRYSRGYVPSPPANPEYPRIIYAVLKRLCMILFTLK